MSPNGANSPSIARRGTVSSGPQPTWVGSFVHQWYRRGASLGAAGEIANAAQAFQQDAWVLGTRVRSQRERYGTDGSAHRKYRHWESHGEVTRTARIG